MRFHRPGLVVAALVLSLGAAACSNEDDTATTPAPTSQTAEPTTTTVRETTSAPTEEPVESIGASSIDHALLAEQVSVVVLPEDEGAAMVAVLDGDGAIEHASVGSDLAGNAPAPDSVFRIGSISKVFTALAILQLVDEGTIDLDAAAADYVQRVPMPDGVTVRDLLQHTSGIPDYLAAPGFFEGVFNDPNRPRSPEETIAEIEGMDSLFEPGASFSYSNTNYSILGVLIEEVSGQSYADELRARIIDPLGLEGTYLATFEDGPPPFDAFASTSFAGPSELIDFDYTSIATSSWAAGGIVSSATDLHVLFSALFDGDIISPDSLAAMTENPEYGLGLARIGPGLYGHDGATPGYRAFVVHASETGTTAFFVVTNDSIETPPPAEPILERIAET